MNKLLLSSLLLASTLAAAAPIRVVLHPVYAPALAAKDKDLPGVIDNKARNVIAATERFVLVDSEAASQALQLQGGSCPHAAQRRVPCLEALAKATGAVYAIEIELRPEGSNSWQLIANIGAANQTPMPQPEPVRLVDSPDVKLNVTAERQTKALLMDGLALSTLPAEPQKPAEPVIVAPVVVQPLPEPVTASNSRATFRIAGFTLAAGAVALGVTTAVFAGLAGSHRSQLFANGRTANGAEPGRAPIAPSDADLGALNAMRTENTLTAVFGIAAGVTAVAAVCLLLYGFSEDEPLPSPQVMLFAAPNGVGVSGRF